MTEAGKVIKIKNGMATVRVDRKSSCEKCGMCAFKPGTPHIDITLADTLGCSVGDTVELEISGGAVVKISVIAYGIPLLSGLIGFAAAYLFELREAWQLVSLAGGLAVGFVLLILLDRRYKRKNVNKPTLTKKI